MAERSLDVVIVSYRSRELVLRCLASLERHAPACRLSVVVVDNASGDGTPGAVRAGFPTVSVLEPGANIGFARATNLGIRLGGAAYVLALNPDTEITAGALDVLLDLMESKADIGCCGCRLVRPDGTFDHAAKRSFPTPLSALGHFTGIGRRRAGGRLAAYRAPDVEEGPVDAVNGAFMLLRRGALDQVGLFDERYWMYMEDLDLCYRLKTAGWVTWYEPGAVVVHHKGGSAGRYRSARLNVAFHAGMLRFYRTHYARRRSLAVNVAVYAGIGVKLAVSLVRSAVARRVMGRAEGAGVARSSA